MELQTGVLSALAECYLGDDSHRKFNPNVLRRRYQTDTEL